MTRGWSLFARIAVALGLFVLVIQLVLVQLYITNRVEPTDTGFRFPLPERIVAFVHLIEAAQDPQDVLTALNSPQLFVWIGDGTQLNAPQEGTHLPFVERALAPYAAALNDREYAAYIALPETLSEDEISRLDRSVVGTYPMRLVIALQGESTLVVETREDVLSEIFSYPIGFWSGLVGLALTGGMLFVLRRETAPLGVLSKAADAFAEDGKARDVVEQGAREIRTLIRSFNRMQNRISGLIEGRQVMLGALGHDLRTYLTRLRLKADAAGVTSLDGDIDHLSAVLENCLALARDASTDRATTPVDLAKVVARCVEETVAIEVEDHPLWVQADPVSLERALRNLLENAQRYGKEPAVHARQDGDSVVVEVADTGPGIPQDQWERLMKPFERGNAARTADGAGSGLGLSLAKLLVERDGGTLSLSQKKPQGLRATMRFPAFQELGEGS